MEERKKNYDVNCGCAICAFITSRKKEETTSITHCFPIISLVFLHAFLLILHFDSVFFYMFFMFIVHCFVLFNFPIDSQRIFISLGCIQPHWTILLCRSYDLIMKNQKSCNNNSKREKSFSSPRFLLFHVICNSSLLLPGKR